MNRMKWGDPNIPLPILALKLSEEAAEVGTEITDTYMGEAWDRDAVIEECDHVIFIAETIKLRVSCNVNTYF